MTSFSSSVKLRDGTPERLCCISFLIPIAIASRFKRSANSWRALGNFFDISSLLKTRPLIKGKESPHFLKNKFKLC